MDNRDPILDNALKDLGTLTFKIDNAELMIKVLSEAGEDVSMQRSALATLKARREKLMTSLRNNGAIDND